MSLIYSFFFNDMLGKYRVRNIYSIQLYSRKEYTLRMRGLVPLAFSMKRCRLPTESMMIG